jgi:hypothetical protein
VISGLSLHELGRILWPAFLTAAGLQILVFGFVDPQDMHRMHDSLNWSRQAVYTVAFFGFWAVAAGGCFLTWLLTRQPVPELD